MPLFMAAIKFSPALTKALVDKRRDRRPAAKAALEPADATIKECYFAFGAADAIDICGATDAVSAASVSMMLSAAASVETTQLLTMEEAMSAMAKADQIQKGYTPPAG